MRGRKDSKTHRRGGPLAAILAAAVVLGELLLGGPLWAGSPAIGDAAPDFTLTLFSGKTFTLGDLKGKPVFMNLFASW